MNIILLLFRSSKKAVSDRIDKIRVRIDVYIKRLDQRLNAENNNDLSFEDLTHHGEDSNDAYTRAVAWALKNENIKNIALTGPYGSGKSSIIARFERMNPQYDYLNISLASFNGDGFDDNEKKQQIELSIFQQLFYKERRRKIRDSRFKRIKHQRKWISLFISATFLLWIGGFIAVFFPKLFKSFPLVGKFPLADHSFILFILFLGVIIGILWGIYKLYTILINSRFSKVNIQSGEFEMNSIEETSILNKHLDEIIYFFEVTKYNVVIIEDLDRFKASEILFVKLRELNNLLNQSRQIHRRIVFLYAVKDELFLKNDRTKFFDFIIPVIPVINYSNSEEIFLRKMKERNLEDCLSANFLSDTSFFIGDMRLLKNILNEFTIYKEKLSDLKLSNYDKLFAIIIYKNLYEEDFSKLHNKEGMVYTIFHERQKIIKHVINQLEKEILSLEQKIDLIDQEFLDSKKELRSVYILAMVEALKAHSVKSLKLGTRSTQITDIMDWVDDELFEEFSRQKNIHFHQQYNEQASGLSFNDIEKKVNPNFSYKIREYRITQKHNDGIGKIKKDLEEKRDQVKKIGTFTISELMQSYDLKEVLPKDILSQDLILYLIRNGYIDEQYSSYISYFYPESMTETDREFLFSIKNRAPLPIDFSLSKIDKIIKKIHDHEFEHEATLNHDLIEFLLENSKKYKDQLDALVLQFPKRTERSIAVFDGYLQNGKRINSLIEQLCSKWGGIWETIEKDIRYTDDKKDELLGLIIRFGDIKSLKRIDANSSLSNYITHKKDFLFLMDDKKFYAKIQKVLEELKITFHSLSEKSANTGLFNFVYEKARYQINQQMIDLIIFTKGNIEDKALKKEENNYTDIINSGCDLLVDYIETNLDYYVSNVFFKLESDNESEQTFVEFLNHEEILEDNKSLLIETKKFVINNLKTVDAEHWLPLIEQNKIEPTWENVLVYYQYCDNSIDESLLKFIDTEQNYSQLSKVWLSNKIISDEALLQQLNTALISSKELSDASYSQIVKKMSYWYPALDLEGFSKVKVKALIDNHRLQVTQKNYETLKQFDLHIHLVEKRIEDFLNKYDLLTVDANDLIKILNSSFINSHRKTSLITKIDIEIIQSSKRLSALVSTFLAKYKVLKLSFSFIKTVLSSGNSNTEKVMVFNKYGSSCNSEQLTELLTAMGGDFVKITLKRKHPSFPLNQWNKEFAHFLNSRGYVRRIEEKKNVIEIWTHTK